MNTDTQNKAKKICPMNEIKVFNAVIIKMIYPYIYNRNTYFQFVIIINL